MQKKDEKQESTHEESPESDGEEVVEKAPIITARDPGSPTQEEIDEHNITHLPHRSWCHICMKARGKEDAHRKQNKKAVKSKPTVTFDYKSVGQEADRDDKAIALVVRDAASKTMFAHICKNKGSSDE